MNRRIRTWTLFGLCLALGLAAMAWATRTTLGAARAEREARARATTESLARQALARMDYTFALFLAPEAARPYAQYLTFHPADRIFTRTQQEVERSELLIPSPFLVTEEPLVRLRFQLEPDGRRSAPLVPAPAQRRLALEVCGRPERIAEAERRLAACTLTRAAVREGLAASGRPPLTLAMVEAARARQAAPGGLASPFRIYPCPWIPFWRDGELHLARQVWLDRAELLQVTWLDWDVLREALLADARALLPDAALRPAPGPAGAGFCMTSLPVLLEPGPLPPGAAPAAGSVRWALALAWAGFLLAGTMAAAVLHHTLRLSARKEAFVSAVTHELRTPLTTFRLYTELLAFGMVPEAERPGFLRTLLAEADRLDHLVKNVLSYARLEAVRARTLDTVTVAELLERPWPRLVQRAGQAGMDLRLELPEALRERRLRTDPAAVEQILFNLVDNACKYAAADPRLEVRVTDDGGAVTVAVRDHGPGIPAPERREVFRAFHKSARKAAQEAPGVGLGLALCRQQAKRLGGSVDLDPQPGEGAVFRLRLPG